jgi:hypothetical protein
MLERVDGVQLAVAESGPAARQLILGAGVVREDESDYLDALRTMLALGASEAELCNERGALLLGISRTTVAWEWSGRPELKEALS